MRPDGGMESKSPTINQRDGGFTKWDRGQPEARGDPQQKDELTLARACKVSTSETKSQKNAEIQARAGRIYSISHEKFYSAMPSATRL